MNVVRSQVYHTERTSLFACSTSAVMQRVARVRQRQLMLGQLIIFSQLFKRGGGTNTVSLHMRHCICSKQDFNEEFITANRGRGDTCVRYDTHFFKAVDRELHQVKTERFASSSLFKPNFAGETVQLSLYTHSAKKPLSVSQL